MGHLIKVLDNPILPNSVMLLTVLGRKLIMERCNASGGNVNVVWDEITRAETLREEAARIRHDLAAAARVFNWPRVLELLSVHGDLINCTRPGGSSLFAPLHHAAYGGATIEVVQRLIRNWCLANASEFPR